MVQPVSRAGEEVNRRMRLTQCQRPWRVKPEMRVMRDERERGDEQDGRKHCVMHEPSFRVRSSTNLELQTSNQSSVPPVSHGHPAGVFSCCPTRVDHRSSLVRTSVFHSLPGLSPSSKHRTKTCVDQDAGDGLSLVTLNLDPPLLDRPSGPAGLLHFLG